MLLAATAVVCKAVFVVGWIALRVVGSWPVLLLGLGIVILFLPDALGPLLSWVLTHKVLHHPVHFGRLTVLPAFTRHGLRVSTVVEDFAVGNPSGFKEPYCLHACNALVTLYMTYSHLWNLHAFIVPVRWQRIIPWTRMCREHTTSFSQRWFKFAGLSDIGAASTTLAAASCSKTARGLGRWASNVQRLNDAPASWRATSLARKVSFQTRSPQARTRNSGLGQGQSEAVDAAAAVALERAGLSEGDVAKVVTIQRAWRRKKVRDRFKNLLRGRWGLVNIERFEASGVTVRFDLQDGDLNVTGFLRQLATGAMRREGTLLAHEKVPNTVKVRVMQARNLKAKDAMPGLFGGKPTSDPYFKVRVGSEKFRTKTVRRSLNPCYDDRFTLLCDNPSAVLSIVAFDEDLGSYDDFLGQWNITLKDLKNKPLDGQWVPLKNRRFITGTSGDILLQAQWIYVEGAMDTYIKPDATAMQQLQHLHVEMQLKMGSMAKVKEILTAFPYLFNVELMCFRHVRVYIEDLFSGRKGVLDEAESTSSKNKVTIPLLHYTNRDVFKLRGMHGHNLYHVFKIIFHSTSSQVMSLGVVANAILSISGGMSRNFKEYLGLGSNEKRNCSWFAYPGCFG
mmetsp:Transcript_38106/g.71454  ORF Transcript_38106/g.71454 Transcript_38106/m.71454 type:complete len:621 (-) Transcript_38106:302-2164(-)